MVRTICAILDELSPGVTPHEKLIEFVTDRPGHDRRYALDTRKIRDELGWQPAEQFAGGMRKTVAWYLDNPQWVASVVSGEYRHWLATNYDKR